MCEGATTKYVLHPLYIIVTLLRSEILVCIALPRLHNISVIRDFRGACNTNPQPLLNHMGWELGMQI